ncbi:MAG: hypothetical protein ABI624_06515 [Casimicrobiaceae bacterium]
MRHPRPPADDHRAPKLPPVTPGARSSGLATTLLGHVFGAAVGRVYVFFGAMLIGIAGLSLTVGWQAGPQKLLDARKFSALTARVPGHIVESWLAVEFDPGDMGQYPHWRPFAKASPCVVVEYATEWTGAARRAFCGSRVTFADHYVLQHLQELTSAVPFSWMRDERGFMMPEIRMSSEAKHWLGTHAPSSYLPPLDPQSATELSELRHAIDRPVDGAVAGWGMAEPSFVLAIDPARPAAPWPAAYVEDPSRRAPDWMLTAFAFLIGLFAWFRGAALIVAGLPRSLAWFIAIAPLLALPWWGQEFPRTLRMMNAPFGSVIGGMLGDVDALTRLVVSAPEDATLASGERLVWRAGSVDYADTFGRFTFKLPQPRPADTDAALMALADTIATQIRALDEPSRVAMFERLARDKKEGRALAGFAFLRAAKESFIAAGSSPELRDKARIFLEAWVTQPVEDPWPKYLGFEARILLLRELMAIPQPNDIAIPAGWIVERAESRKHEPPLKPSD